MVPVVIVLTFPRPIKGVDRIKRDTQKRLYREHGILVPLRMIVVAGEVA
jgi:hypothetical protein